MIPSSKWKAEVRAAIADLVALAPSRADAAKAIVRKRLDLLLSNVPPELAADHTGCVLCAAELAVEHDPISWGSFTGRLARGA